MQIAIYIYIVKIDWRSVTFLRSRLMARSVKTLRDTLSSATKLFSLHSTGPKIHTLRRYMTRLELSQNLGLEKLYYLCTLYLPVPHVDEGGYAVEGGHHDV